MSHLQSLKLAVRPTTTNISAELLRRNKLIVRLQEQLQLAEAQLSNTPYIKYKWVTAADSDGEPVRVQRPVKLRQWWTKTLAGNIMMTVRYGKKAVEFSKGLNAIQVTDLSALPTVISTLIKAVDAGELDSQLSAIAADNPFTRRIKPVAKTAIKRN